MAKPTGYYAALVVKENPIDIIQQIRSLDGELEEKDNIALVT
ncbi:MAG: hypothetical protein AAF703_02380 [Cyanobacteria bacterium P01_D01_bin.105]